MIEAGQTAPDFTLTDQHGKPVTLSELRGAPVVLYFYPKADTPGCTIQACGVRDRTPEYAEAGAKVVGVSLDSVEEVKRFADKFSLDFELLADQDHSVADLYGTWMQKNSFGNTFWGVQRATFIIDSKGEVAKVFPKVSPKTHDDVVLEALAELRAAT